MFFFGFASVQGFSCENNRVDFFVDEIKYYATKSKCVDSPLTIKGRLPQSLSKKELISTVDKMLAAISSEKLLSWFNRDLLRSELKEINYKSWGKINKRFFHCYDNTDKFQCQHFFILRLKQGGMELNYNKFR